MYSKWCGEHTVNLQKELIEQGYAKVAYIYGDYLYTNELKNVEKNIKERKIGVWSDQTLNNKEDKEKSISELITDFINDLIDEIIKSVKKTIKKEIKKIFN